MSKTKKVVKALGYIVAFVAPTDIAASEFLIQLNTELKTKSLGKVLTLTKTYDGFWISVDGSNEEISDLVFELGRAQQGIRIACVIPSSERLGGNDVICFQGENPRSLIRLILGVPDTSEVWAD